MKRNCSILWFLVILLGNLQVYGQDGADDETSNQVDNNVAAANYLTEYGYIEQSGDAERLITEDVLTEAILAFQRRYQLDPTGILDDETKALMSTPRCGNPDIDQGGTRKKRYELIGQRWPSNVITWLIEGYPLDDDLPFTQVHEEIRTAFRRWEDASALTFVQVSNSPSGNIRLSFQRRNHNDGDAFDGPGGVLAHAFIPPRNFRNPQGGNVHFDDEELFRTDLTNQGVILHQVATHEIGHSLGLGHSKDRNAVMAPFYRRVSPSSFQLQQDDINGIQAIYGKPITNNPPAPAAPATPPPTPPTPPTTKVTAAPTTPTRTMPPIFCNGQFDAVTEAFDDSSLYLFQGYLVFRYDFVRRVIVPGYPKPVWEEFTGVPGFIDAALTYVVTPTYRIMYLYKGDNYWRFDNGAAKAGYPRSITASWGGIPANLDGAFIWTGNGLWYFIKDKQYYRFNILRGAMDPGYPRPLSIWRGIPSEVDAVATFGGTTYFFGGQYYQRFNDRSFFANRQSQTAPEFLGCITQGLELLETTEIPTTLLEDSGSVPLGSRFIAVLISLVICLLHVY